MTIITNRRAVLLVVLLLAFVLLYFGYRQDVPSSAEEETAALLQQMGKDSDQETANEESGTEETLGVKQLPELGAMEQDFFQETLQEKLPLTSGLEFFVNYRLERDRIRSLEVDMLQQIVDDPNSVAESRQEAQNLTMEISRKMEQEMQLENLIKAKGYEDAAVFIDKTSVFVIVLSPSLAEQDVTRIADLIARITGHKMEDIVIIPKG